MTWRDVRIDPLRMRLFCEREGGFEPVVVVEPRRNTASKQRVVQDIPPR
jgi:hypothetical protein